MPSVAPAAPRPAVTAGKEPATHEPATPFAYSRAMLRVPRRTAFRPGRRALLAACVALLAGSSPAPAAEEGAEARRALPRIEGEPLVRVFLAKGARVRVHLDAPTRLEAGGLVATLEPGTATFEARGAGWRVVGGPSFPGGPGVLRSGGRPVFTVEAQPRFGEPRSLRLAGDLILLPEEGELSVLESVLLEDYLASVVGAEMNPKWPRQALGAQAIVARSYAAARWLERRRSAWHLHWHFGVDMAYHGWSEEDRRVAEAIASTRGEVLAYRGFPVLALFHASSGGVTESFARIKPGVLAPDGETSVAGAMPVVADPAALPGAAGLDLYDTHGRWKADLRLPDVTEALRRWSAEGEGRPRFGEVEAVSVEERHPDSGRVASVSVRHRLDGHSRFTRLAGVDFRSAVGPLAVRSLLWDRCVVASQEPGYLVLEGRGFGHGCGLSQVSAWYLANEGRTAEEIVGRFYSGARIQRWY